MFGMAIDVKEEHPSKAKSPIVVTLFGMMMEVKEEHPQNAPFLIVVTLFGMVIEVREEHLKNASSPIVVIPSEIMTFLTSLFDSSHGLAKESLKFIISPSPVKVISHVSLSNFQSIVPIVPDVKEEHPANAHTPIVVTLFGMMMEVKEEHL